MPPALTTPPPVTAFSRNRIPLVIESADYLAAGAVKAVNFFEVTAAIATDYQILITWQGAAATMTAKAVPDDTGLQFATGDGTNAYVTAILADFKGNYFLNRDFVMTTDFTGAHPRIKFTAKKPGPDYNFLTENGGATGVTTPGVTDQPISNFRHHVELWIEMADGSAFQQAYTANVPLDEPLTGKTTLDIHAELNAFLYKQYDRPVISTDKQICANTKRRYFVLYAKYYGTTPAIKKAFTSGIFHLYKGGLSKAQALLRDFTTELTVEDHPEQNRFLRQGSKNKLVTTEQPEWLTWINPTNAAVDIVPEVTVYNNDLGDPFVFNIFAAYSVPAYGKIQFIAGFTQLAITARQAGKTPIYYTVRVKIGADYYTDTYAFVLDYKFREWPRYFVYENSYGAFQTIGTVGKGLAEVDRTTDQVQKAVDPYIAAIDGEFNETNIRIQDKFTVNIGYERSGPRNVALMRDFLASEKIYEWFDGVLMPIGLNTKNLKDAEDGVNVYAQTLEYYPLYDDVDYTEPAGLADDSIAQLLSIAGSPIPPAVAPPDPGDGGDGSGSAIVVESDDEHLGSAGDNQTYTAPILVGRENYRIYSTQLGLYFRTEDVTYNSGAGKFTILVEGFVLLAGEQLIILPYVLNPDE